jgi:hypothetical protein
MQHRNFQRNRRLASNREAVYLQDNPPAQTGGIGGLANTRRRSPKTTFFAGILAAENGSGIGPNTEPCFANTARPLTPTACGKPLTAGEVWTGPESVFKRAGFRLERDDPKHPIYGRPLDPRSERRSRDS